MYTTRAPTPAVSPGLTVTTMSPFFDVSCSAVSPVASAVAGDVRAAVDGIEHGVSWVRPFADPRAASSARAASAAARLLDEAGQLSLAHVLAAARAARNLILVGDPQQLAQPSKGTHPVGVDASALEHILAGAATMPDDMGLFMEHTRRLHPGVCAFISELAYEGRLEPEHFCSQRSVDHGPLVGGTGLRWVPIQHHDNRTSSPQEVEAVAEHYLALLGRGFADLDGHRELTPKDILVVAPYNAQVAHLASALPDGARVGTVNKFLGQQAPVVIISLAASSAQHIPRGMKFLYSRNRLNVAVSRAQSLAILVANPALLNAVCRTVEQLRLANGLCRFVEHAGAVPA